jgi:hypothetical protein
LLTASLSFARSTDDKMVGAVVYTDLDGFKSAGDKLFDDDITKEFLKTIDIECFYALEKLEA